MDKESLLTGKQKHLLNMAKERGFVTFSDFEMIYSSPVSQKANLKRFIALGLLKEEGLKFVYVGDKNE